MIFRVLGFTCTQFAAHDFSGCGHGKIVDELDFAWVLVRGKTIADMGSNFLGQGGIRFDAVIGNNKDFDDFRADWVRFADGRGQQDGSSGNPRSRRGQCDTRRW